MYHIIQNYDNLSNIVVFLPGSVNMGHKKNKAIKILELIIKSNFKSAYFLGNYHNSLYEHFKNFTMNSYCSQNSVNYKKNPESKLQLCKIRPYGKWYKYFFGNDLAHWSTFYGVFSIDKRDIIQHPVDKYKLIIQSVSMSSNPEAGHYIERSWGAIFYPLIHTAKVLHN